MKFFSDPQLLVIFVSTFAALNLFAYEVTDSTEAEDIEPQVSKRVDDKTCTSVENAYRKQVLVDLKVSQRRVQDSITCLSQAQSASAKCKTINSAYISSMKSYRESLGQFYKEIGNHWAEQKIKTTGDYAKGCLLNSQGKVEQTSNIRILKNQNTSNPQSCQVMLNNFPQTLNQQVLSVFNGNTQLPGRSKQDIKQIQEFAQTPYVRLVPDRIKYQSNITDDEIRLGIKKSLEKVASSMGKLEKHINELSDAELYILYDFKEHFKKFTSTDSQGSLALICSQRTGLIKDCRPFQLSLKRIRRCTSRKLKLLQEFLPIIPTISAMISMDYTRGAEASDLMTGDEATNKRIELTTKGLFGLTGTGAMVLKPATKAIRLGINATKGPLRRARVKPTATRAPKPVPNSAPMVGQTAKAARQLPQGSPERLAAQEVNEMTQSFWRGILAKSKGISGGIKARVAHALKKSGVDKPTREKFIRECIYKPKASIYKLFFSTAIAITPKREAKCVGWMEELYEKIYRPNEKLNDDLQNVTSYPYYGRTRNLLEATDAKTIDSLFNAKTGISPKDVDDMFFLAMADDRMTNQQREMMVELKHMVDDMPNLFWPKDGSLPSYHARMMLRKADASRGYSDDPAVAAKMTEQALRSTEVETIARALGETFAKKKYANSKWYDRFVRFFLPHHKRVKNIIDTNNALRKQLQHSYKRNEPIIDALSSEVPLTAAEKQALQKITGKTSTTVSGIRKEITEIYGREVSPSNPLREAGIRIRDISKRANAGQETKDFNSLVRESEKDMNILETTMDKASRRQGAPRWEMGDRHDTYYQIRNPQQIRETGVNTNKYHRQTAKHPTDSSYGVRKEWEVTVRHEEWKTRTVQKDGKDVEESYLDVWHSYYTRQADDSLKARFEEVLTEKITPRVNELSPLPYAEPRGLHAVSASNGEPRIISVDTARQKVLLKRARYLRPKENPHRTAIDSAIQHTSRINQAHYETLLANPSQMEAEIAGLAKMREGLNQNAAQVQKYMQWTDDRIMKNYPNDRPEIFRSRNRRLHERITHMIRRSEHLEEQLSRRAPTLRITYQTTAYPEQMAKLAARARRNRYIQSGVGTATTISVGAGGYYYYQDPENAQRKIRQGRDAVIDKYNTLRGTLLDTKNNILEGLQGNQ